MVKEIPRDQGIYVFSPGNPPVATVDPGEEIVFSTLDAFSGQISSESDSPAELDFSAVNAATGPVFVAGASPGDTLKVEVLEIFLDEVGYQCVVPGFGLLKDRFTSPAVRECRVREGWVHVGEERVRSSSSIGTIGVAPAEQEIPTIQPGDHGGNLDAREIGEGVALYLPVSVEGALLAMGDVHAVQGDGEVCGVAVEIGARIRVRVSLVPGRVSRPVVVTRDSVITLASAEDLDEAAETATGDMVDLWARAGYDPLKTYLDLTLMGHLGVSQMVNPWKTAKMVAPRPEGFTLDQ